MSFARLLKPRSIAVFGGDQAAEVVRQCQAMGYKGQLWPVHPKRSEVEGLEAYPSVEALPGSPDAAYLAVNRHLTVDIVGALAARDAGGAVCYATGFAEAGEEGAELQGRLLEACGDMPLVGPNCYGMLNYVDGAMLWPDQQGGRRVDRGVAIITASSNVAFNLTSQRRGLPVAYVATLGNKLRFDLHDAVSEFAALESVTAIGLYIESLTDPAAFDRAVAVARELGKPVAAIKVGRSEAARKMVVSHTASLAGADDLMDALFERTGVARVRSLEQLMEALKVLHVLGPMPGGRIGAMSTSGGDLALLGDALGETGLEMPELSPEGTEAVAATVHERIVVANPLDYQMFDWNDEERLAATFSAFAEEGFDLTLSLLDYPRPDRCDGSTWAGADHGFIRAAQNTRRPSGVLSTFADTMSEEYADRLIGAGIVPLCGIDDGVAGIQAAVDVGSAWGRPASPPPLAASASDEIEEVPTGGVLLDEARSKRFLAEIGVRVPRSIVVSGADEAIAAAEELGDPIVLKALGVAHKSDVGGVALGLEGRDAVAEAVRDMEPLAGSFLVEEMIEGGVAEVIVGISRDPQFGPYLVVGGGGVLVELARDSRPLLVPTSGDRVRRAFEGLRCSPLFHGFRGAAPADLDAAVDVVLSLAQRIEDSPDEILELDINPLLLLAEGRGAVAVDALLRLREGPR